MDVFEEIADERRAVSDMAVGLSPDQPATPSLCTRWTVRDVVAHLRMPLETRLPQVLRVRLEVTDLDWASGRGRGRPGDGGGPAAGGGGHRGARRGGRGSAQAPYAGALSPLRHAGARRTPEGAAGHRG